VIIINILLVAANRRNKAKNNANKVKSHKKKLVGVKVTTQYRCQEFFSE